MLKEQALQVATKPQERTHRTLGSVSALLVQLVERHERNKFRKTGPTFTPLEAAKDLQ